MQLYGKSKNPGSQWYDKLYPKLQSYRKNKRKLRKKARRNNKKLCKYDI